MRFLVLISIILVSDLSSAVEYRDNGQNVVIAPFGIPSRQPPAPGRVVRIPETRLSISAQQVCGYTDFTTLQIDLPKKLLSKQYWQNVGNALVNQAKQTVLDLSHALPSMLACNVSPTFCHVINQAEMMAGFEGELNMETCKIVDGLANRTIMNDDLRQCMGSWKDYKGLTASEAREKCLTNGVKGARNPNDKAGAIKEAREEAEANGHKSERFDMNKFLDELFPESVKTVNGTHHFNSGGHRYSRRERVLPLSKQLFPGIEVKGSAVVRNGGTFQPTIEKDLKKETKEIQDEIYVILKEMKKWQDKGFNGPDVMNKSRHIWGDKEKWKRNKKPSPIYRETIDGSEPSLLVQPEQIYSLLPLASEKIDGNQYLSQVIARISQSTAYLKSQDKLYDILSRSMNNCQKPKYQNPVGQENCEKIIAGTRTSMQILEHKMVAEERVRKVQDEISQIVRATQMSRAARLRSSSDSKFTPNTDGIPLPHIGG